MKADEGPLLQTGVSTNKVELQLQSHEQWKHCRGPRERSAARSGTKTNAQTPTTDRADLDPHPTDRSDPTQDTTRQDDDDTTPSHSHNHKSKSQHAAVAARAAVASSAVCGVCRCRLQPLYPDPASATQRSAPEPKPPNSPRRRRRSGKVSGISWSVVA